MEQFHRRRQQNSSFMVFVASDWRLLLQLAAFAVALSLLESMREVLWGTADGVELSAVLIFSSNFVLTISLLVPLVLFVLAGHCFSPHSSPLLKRIFSAFLFALYLLFAILEGSQADNLLFHWEADRSFRSLNFYSAGAAALLLISILIVFYRYAASAKSIWGTLLRVAGEALFLFGLLQIDRMTLQFSDGREGNPANNIRFVLIIDDFSFESANLFLNQQADKKLIHSTQQFRPLMMNTESSVAQLATLFTGQLPYENGLRQNRTEGSQWNLFHENWLSQVADLYIGKQKHALHATNITFPSPLFDFFQTERSGTRCPMPSAKNLPDYQLMNRLKATLLPFVPQWTYQLALPLTPCVPLSIPIDDLIHREMMGALFNSSEQTSAENNSSPVPTLSIWHINLDRFGGPALQITNGEALQQSTDSKGMKAEAQAGQLKLLLGALRANLNRKDLGEKKPHVEFYVVGLSPRAESLGSYFVVSFDQLTPAEWPLPLENKLIGLSELHAAIFNGAESQKTLSSSIYHEKPLDDQNLTDRQRALLTERVAECSEALEGRQNVKHLQGKFRLVDSKITWSEKWDPDYQTAQLQPSGGCKNVIVNVLRNSVDQDIALFEPFPHETGPFASPNLDLSNKDEDSRQ